MKELEFDIDENAVVLEPRRIFDPAIIGTEASSGRAVYGYSRLVRQLTKNHGMTYDEAVEFLDYNTMRAIPYMGEMAPIIVFDNCKNSEV